MGKTFFALFVFLTVVAEVFGQRIIRRYDSLGTLTFVQYPDSSSITYVYDANGNLIRKTYHDPCTTKPRPVVSASGPLTFCAGGSVVLSSTPGISSQWSTGAVGNSISITSAGTYWVQRLDSFVIVGTTDTIQCVLKSDTIVVTVNPFPTVTPVPNQVTCNGEMTGVINFNSGTPSTTYNWTNDNTTIGLAASGTGNIGSFTANNLGTTSVSASVIVTPTAGGCVGLPDTFVITVNPTPTASVASSQVLCAGNSTSVIIFSGSVSSTIFNWTNTNSAIGLASSGTGNIPSFTTVNGTLVPLIATISVTPEANGCSGAPQEHTVTVNPLPSAIPGSGTICIGTTVSLSNAISGGTWNSSNGNISIGSSSGLALGVSMGTALITYTLPTGCKTVRVFTVSPLPAAITGTTHVCAGYTATLSNPTSGGIWNSDSSSIVTVGATTGVVTGVSPGVGTISYTLSTGCSVSTQVTVNSFPSPISGPSSVCTGATISLGNEVSGGTWSSSNTAIASIGSASGIVTGVTVSTAAITYSLGGGCFVIKGIFVYPLPNVIAGPSTVCTGTTISLSNSSLGGTWSSSNTGVASIGSTGIVAGISPGDANISYTLGTGCFRSKSVTVNISPTPITGPNTVCSGSSITMSNATPGGTWGTVATVFSVNSLSGLVTGIGVGTSSVTYTLPTGCAATKLITAYLSPGSISGTDTVCVGSSGVMYNSTPGGTWSSSNGAVVSIVPTSGVVTGISVGTGIISYVLSNGCFSTDIATINPLPADIVGSDTLCVGYTSILSDISPGGTWTSSNTTKATVGATTGLVTGISSGAATISYTLPTGCRKMMPISIYNLPASITGSGQVCVGTTTSLTSATSGGLWSSGDLSVATVGSTGMVSGISTGTTEITYMLPTGCYRTIIVTVNPVPATISGGTTVCVGATTSVNNATPVGTWSSSATGIATVGSTTGLVTGQSAGTAIITYMLATGCYSTTSFTVNALPPSSSGASSVCVGSSIVLSNVVAGGTWSTSNLAVASVGSLSGIVSGNSAGTAYITYILSTGCLRTKLITVNPLPASISGATTVCIGATTTLSNTASGGIWSSATPSIASITSGSGIVSGISAGTVQISYMLSTGCLATTVLTVNPVPTTISGTVAVCIAHSTNLSSSPTGGTWASANLGIATVGSLSGSVTGLAAGTSRITYTLPTGCMITRIVTVLPYPPAISGSASVCQGMTITLSNSVAGGTWSSPDGAGVLSIGSTGLLSGISPGTGTILYTLSSGCSAARIITVNALPPAIGGSSSVCPGTQVILTNSVSGGAWTSSNISRASVNATSGVLTGLSAGTVVVTYALGTGCYTTKVVTVHPAVATITGPYNVCENASVTFGNSTSGGVWSSSNLAVGSIGSTTGVFLGISAGTVTISYTIPSTSCFSMRTVSVNTSPTVISGSTIFCAGNTTTFSATPSGGTWSSSNTSVATVGVTGVATGVSAGTAKISYSLSTGCRAIQGITVNPLPSTIGGAFTMCIGSGVALTNATSGGTWLSGNPAIASIGSSSGTVTGISPGTSMVSYTLSTGCIKTAIVTVNPSPSAISGPSSVCVGGSVTLSDPATGGTWSSSNTGTATVGMTSGVVSGVSSGICIITYVVTPGCYATKTISVNTTPATISGPTSICSGSSATLSNAISGGTWVSGNTAVVSIGSSTGIVSGIASGTASVTYTLSSGCFVTRIITINPLPTSIAGSSSVCIGYPSLFSNSTIGGIWSSSNVDVATVGSVSGSVVGVNTGTVVITYTVPTGCFSTHTLTVLVSPSAIYGAASFCQGTTESVTCYPTGGTWSSSNTSIATIGTSGVISGISNGTVRITYTVGSGCIVTKVITVNPLPAVITGTLSVCSGLNTSLGNASGGGTWSSSSVTTAYVSTTGVVTGYSTGTATITYINGTGCIRTATVTVNESPSAITGSGSICVSATLALGNTVSGGTWGSSSPTIATINSGTGVVTGINAGTPTMTYTLPNGCRRTCVVTINPLPGAIGGPSSLCVGSIITQTNTLPGGTWSSGNTAVGTIGAGSGIVYGISTGTTQISYVSSMGCTATKVVSVNGMPSSGVISGPTAVSIGSTITLSSTVSGGTWSSSNTTKATVSSGGTVTGISAGSCTISYRVTNACGSSVTTYGVAIASSRIAMDPVHAADFGKRIRVFPNPNSGMFTISGAFDEEDGKLVQLKVADIVGRTVFAGVVSIHDKQLNAEVALDERLASGTYILVVQSDSQVGNFHIIVCR